MNALLEHIRSISDHLAVAYHLNVAFFFAVYLLSFLPFYLGYFLMLHGATRSLNWRDIVSLKFKGSIQWNKQSRVGLYVHLFGRIMPYAYILILGRHLPFWVYALVAGIVCLAPYLVFRKIRAYRQKRRLQDISIVRKDCIEDATAAERLWAIYEETFKPVNKITPCKQSLDREHFIETLHDATVRKYVFTRSNGDVIGIGMITNNFFNTPWISADYFETNYP